MTVQTRRERYRSELRAETLSAARDLMQEKGYEGLTLRKLAQRMRCSPMALYTYSAGQTSPTDCSRTGSAMLMTTQHQSRI